MNDVKEIIWDFDGVILLSDEVREYGFRKIFEDHNPEKVEKLIEYHLANGGLSRYAKIRYYYENVLNSEITEKEIDAYANNFSVIMRNALINKDLINPEWIELMGKIGNKYVHSIASGSDGKELNYLCNELQLSHYFKSILGSPVVKNELVKNIIADSTYSTSQIILIGDAVNDKEAAEINNIGFIGYRSRALQDCSFFTNDLTTLTNIL